MKSEELYKKTNNLYKNEKYFEALSFYQKIKERNISLFIDKDINRCKKINEIQNIKPKIPFYGSISENKLKIINELKNSFPEQAFNGFQMPLSRTKRIFGKFSNRIKHKFKICF